MKTILTHRLAVNIYFGVNGFVYANWASRIPAIQDQYELSNQQLGIILLAHAVGAFLAMPFTGFLINRYSSRKITMLSGLIFPVFLPFIPYMEIYTFLLLPFFFMGIATGMMDVAINAQAVEIEKDLKKPIMTMFHAIFSIGMVIGGLFGGLGITNNWDISFHFPFVTIVSLLFLLWGATNLFPDKISHQNQEPWIAIPKGPIIGLGLIAFCCMMGEGAVADWSTNYLQKVILATENLQALGLTVFAAAMTGARLVGDQGRLKIGDANMMLCGGVLSLLGIGLVLSLMHPYIIIFGFGLLGLGLANIVPIVYSQAGSIPNISPGAGIAMATTIGYSGFMFGPPIIGFIADISSLHVALMVLALLLVLMTTLILYYRFTEKS